jgi:hypothetical protein
MLTRVPSWSSEASAGVRQNRFAITCATRSRGRPAIAIARLCTRLTFARVTTSGGRASNGVSAMNAPSVSVSDATPGLRTTRADRRDKVPDLASAARQTRLNSFSHFNPWMANRLSGASPQGGESMTGWMAAARPHAIS